MRGSIELIVNAVSTYQESEFAPGLESHLRLLIFSLSEGEILAVREALSNLEPKSRFQKLAVHLPFQLTQARLAFLTGLG